MPPGWTEVARDAEEAVSHRLSPAWVRAVPACSCAPGCVCAAAPAWDSSVRGSVGGCGVQEGMAALAFVFF